MHDAAHSHNNGLDSTLPLPLPLASETPIAPKKRGGPVHLLAGSAGGLISAALLQPFDVLKTRVQQGSHGSLLSVLRGTLAGSHTPLQRTPLHGLQNLWRGTLPSVLRSSVGSGLYFFTLNEMRSRLPRSSQGHLSSQANLLTGAFARASVGIIMMPVTVIKVRFESSLYRYHSIRQAAGAIAKENGFRGFFYGSAATALRDAPHAGLYVSIYEWSKKRLTALAGKPNSQVEGAWMVNFASGLVAGFAATLLTNPFDVVRTRAQLEPAKYPSFWKAARRLAREDGVRCFLDGVGLRIARKSVSSAFTWTLYELILAKA
ncbi:solute carrier family 25 member 38 [Protomyces lactucae-debilis]|uniref:Mitochondrial glycine transporter n=1 Tax=Protomyces lactucae-debilis TaxID=2754530 RepID=A0A1Y2EV23_PROLT|nr:solute carrier family 25 member 38 [Protomyces lactucae-debilis]ORY75420.1 solute carrier family 25 member 38 [Protomyces lactucae-debilis]